MHTKTRKTQEILNWIETQATGFFVDGTYGSDTDNDGSFYKPFATPDKAIQAGIARGDDVIEITVNPNHGTYTADIPDGIEVAISTLTSLVAGGAHDAFTVIALGDASILHIDNLYTLEIREKSGVASASLWAEESLIGGIRNFDGSGPATHITANFSDTYLTGTAMSDIGSLPEVSGSVIDWSTKKKYELAGLSNAGEPIEEVGGPVNSDDAATKDYVDTELTKIEGTTIKSTGEASGKILTSDGANGASWQSQAPDPNAIHDNVAGEINAIAEKTTFDDDDEILLEDNSASYAKKKGLLSKLREYFGRTWAVHTYAYNLYGVSGTFNGVSCNAAGLSGLSSSNGMQLMRSFDDGGGSGRAEAAVCTLKLPPAYKAGDDIDVVFDWCAAATSGNVAFGVGIRAMGNGDKMDGTFTYQTGTAAPNNSTSYGKVSTAVTFTGTNFSPGDTVAICFYRDADDGSDTMSGDVLISTVEIRRS
ncbi:MAG: hypothetical protein ACTSX2_00055 [Candidatus Thorarchaeota archaeon]